MRTSIIFGLMSIADSINADFQDEGVIALGALIFIVGALMDIAEFVKKIIK